MRNIVIIGNGIAGTTAAREIRKISNDNIYIISAESEYFYSRTALMYIYMKELLFKDTMPYEKSFWKKNKIDLIFDLVERVDFDLKKVYLTELGELKYDELIFACGSTSKDLNNWSSITGVKSLYSIHDLNAIESLTQNIANAVVVGGGLIGIELVEMLLSRNISVDFIIKDKHFLGNQIPDDDGDFLKDKFSKIKNLKIHYNCQIAELKNDKNNKIQSVTLSNQNTINTNFLGLAIGVEPNINWINNKQLSTHKGILVDDNLKTNLPNVYAIGDCAEIKQEFVQNGRKAIEPLWYTGKKMGEHVAKIICGSKERYNQGIWFNSAKFFDLIYHAYGTVLSTKSDSIKSFIYTDQEVFMHLQFTADKSNIIGVNAYGIKLRQNQFEKWITQKANIEEVVKHFNLAMFEHEFSKPYHKKIVESYNLQFQQNITIESTSWWRKLIKPKL